MDLALPATWQQVWVHGLTEAAQQLMKEGRYEEACRKMEQAAAVADKFHICVAVQEHEDGPVKMEPLSQLCADAMDSTAASRTRRDRRALRSRSVSEDWVRSVLAMTEKVNSGSLYIR